MAGGKSRRHHHQLPLAVEDEESQTDTDTETNNGFYVSGPEAAAIMAEYMIDQQEHPDSEDEHIVPTDSYDINNVDLIEPRFSVGQMVCIRQEGPDSSTLGKKNKDDGSYWSESTYHILAARRRCGFPSQDEKSWTEEEWEEEQMTASREAIPDDSFDHDCVGADGNEPCDGCDLREKYEWCYKLWYNSGQFPLFPGTLSPWFAAGWLAFNAEEDYHPPDLEADGGNCMEGESIGDIDGN
ncbi:hypothetical protein LTR84_005374 [Exophiala bonariae]|uniref:Uncharacterized protein n=1 Tax=Exophiala bonariae TaxID=1690606 RepID=A0AAV9N3P0_9EURO|nr:hypothetical protein LTR84_005374 [Exophiala bonariae]